MKLIPNVVPEAHPEAQAEARAGPAPAPRAGTGPRWRKMEEPAETGADGPDCRRPAPDAARPFPNWWGPEAYGPTP